MIGNNNENNNKNNNNNDRTTIINATTEFNSSRLSKSYLNTVRYPYSKTLGLVFKQYVIRDFCTMACGIKTANI